MEFAEKSMYENHLRNSKGSLWGTPRGIFGGIHKEISGKFSEEFPKKCFGGF